MNKNYTHISMVLDRSGSMSSIATDTIGGVNQFFQTQKKAPGVCTATLVQFDDVIETVFGNLEIQKVAELTRETYQPRNSTALYDAVGQTIEETGRFLEKMKEKDRPGKVIFVIVTDGYENASRKFNQPKVFDMIKHQRETYQWEFVYIGANQDALAVGSGIGIPGTHAINYAGNTIGTHAIYMSVGSNVLRARASAGAGIISADCMSWSKDQRDEQDKAAGKTPKKKGAKKI